VRRLLLFDIDGTLVWGGPAKRAFHSAMVETFGTAGDIEVHSFAGKTDPQIARELLQGAGLPDPEIDAGLPDLFGRYLEGLEAGLEENPMEVLRGVVELLDALAEEDGMGLALVTGNVAGGARLKLGSAGLMHHFSFGGYGSDSEYRDDLPGVAIQRAQEVWGVEFAGEDVVVIGDTPRDVQCGRAAGTVTVGVATGSFEANDLADAGAHHVVEDFRDTRSVLELLRA